MHKPKDPRKDILAQTVLISTCQGDPDNANASLQILQQEYGWEGVYYAVFRWMDLAVQMQDIDLDNYGEDAFATLSAVTPDGQIKGVDEVNNLPAAVTAMQIFTAFLNRQYETAVALFTAGVNNDQGSLIIVILLNCCAGLTRDYLAEHKEDIVVGTEEPNPS